MNARTARRGLLLATAASLLLGACGGNGEAGGGPHKGHVVQRGPGQTDLHMISLSGGLSLQAYVDPATRGDNEVHFTFFDAAGGELAVAEATISATPVGGVGRELEARRLAPGHFVAGAQLEPGSWMFAIEASTEDGAPLTAQFDQEIRE